MKAEPPGRSGPGGGRCSGKLDGTLSSQKPPLTQDVECDWCRWPLGREVVEWNNGRGHDACARYAYECVMGPDALPWRPDRGWRRDEARFLERLGYEAAKLGINPRRLATAVARARA
jgi:hypothetical protein